MTLAVSAVRCATRWWHTRSVSKLFFAVSLVSIDLNSIRSFGERLCHFAHQRSDDTDDWTRSAAGASAVQMPRRIWSTGLPRCQWFLRGGQEDNFPIPRHLGAVRTDNSFFRVIVWELRPWAGCEPIPLAFPSPRTTILHRGASRDTWAEA